MLENSGPGYFVRYVFRRFCGYRWPASWIYWQRLNADRVAVSHRFDNGLGFGVEAKWKTGGDTDKQDRPFNEIVGNGHEESINWRWKATDDFALNPEL